MQARALEVELADAPKYKASGPPHGLRIALMLLAAATIVPASIFLEYTDTNPSIESFALVTVGSFVILALTAGILYWWRRSEIVAVPVVLAWICLATFGRFGDRNTTGLQRTVLLLALIAIAAVFIRMFREKIVTWLLLASVMSLIATGSQLAFAMSTTASPTEFSASNHGLLKPKGSFYLIVVDGYGPLSGGTSEEAEFLTKLEDRRVSVVPDAIANYSFTYSSLSNTLSLDHRFKGPTQRSEIFDTMQGANPMRAVFEQAGWRYVHIESDWTGTRCGPTVTNCVENGWVDDFVWEFFQTSYFGPQIERSTTHPHVGQGLRSLAALEEHARETDTGRDFVFAHILLPHPPLQLNSDCDVLIDERLLGQYYRLLETNAETMALRQSGYRHQTACLNARLVSLLESIDESASVVITADHGPDLRGQLDKLLAAWDADDLEQRFRIFHAARLRNGCERSGRHDLVNLIRSEVQCVTGASLPAIAQHFEISPDFWSDDEARVLTEEDLSGWLDDH